MKTNDLKRGALVRLSNGWSAEIMDNMRGNTRLAKVFGDFIDVGSVYAHDIAWACLDKSTDLWEPITHTAAQLKLKEQLSSLNFR
jgi:hypothetical protein